MNTTKETVSLPPYRLWLMRALYFITFIGLIQDAWSTLLDPGETLTTLEGVAYSFWASYAALMGLGMRYPTKMLPLIFLQLLYKAIWLLFVYRPMKDAAALTPHAEAFFWICVVAIILDVLVIPWKYTYHEYIAGFFNFRKKKVAQPA